MFDRKFRGMPYRGGKMITSGSIIRFEGDDTVYLGAAGGSVRGNWEDVEGLTYLINEHGKPFAVEVDPGTVSVDTGTIDCSGTLIFGGDILRVPAVVFPDGSSVPEAVVEVRWGDGGWELTEPRRSAPDVLDADTAAQCEIIGNIWDSPELLRADHE